jgi:hypothetical protein
MISCTVFWRGLQYAPEEHNGEHGLRYACAALALVFGSCFFWNSGFPPRAPLADGNWLFAALMVFYFAFPFAQKLEIGRIVKFEAKVEPKDRKRT